MKKIYNSNILKFSLIIILFLIFTLIIINIKFFNLEYLNKDILKSFILLNIIYIFAFIFTFFIIFYIVNFHKKKIKNDINSFFVLKKDYNDSDIFTLLNYIKDLMSSLSFDETIIQDTFDKLIDYFIKKEIELKNTKSFSESIFNNINESIITIDEQDQIISVNPFFLKTTNYTFKTIIRKSINDIISRDNENTYLLNSNNIKTPVNIYISKFERDSNYYKIYFIIDITEEINRKKFEKYASYQAGIAEFSSTLLHNVGNSINTILDKSNQLKNEIDDLIKISKLIDNNLDRDKEKLLNLISKTLNKMYDEKLSILIESLLKNINHTAQILKLQRSSIKTDFNLEYFNIKKLIDNVFESQEYSLNKNNIKVIKIIDKNIIVRLPFISILQLLINIIKNSIEALNEKGEYENYNKYINLSQNVINEKFFKLKIEDNGIGIEKNKLKELYKYGYTTKKEGTGIGLHSASNFIQSINGKMNIYSKGINEGTTVIIIIPINAKEGFLDE